MSKRNNAYAYVCMFVYVNVCDQINYIKKCIHCVQLIGTTYVSLKLKPTVN